MHVMEEPKSFLIIDKINYLNHEKSIGKIQCTSCSAESDESALKSRFELLDPIELLFVMVLRLVIVF